MARPKKSKGTVVGVPQVNDFNITLTIGGKSYEGNGTTLLDALVALPRPEKIASKAMLTITNGKMKGEQQYWPTRLKRLFYNKYFQTIQAKNLALMLKPV